jgi:hypothetical protein
MFKATKLFLLVFAAAAAALLSSSCIIFEDAEVKYTWDIGQEYRIDMVAAGYDGVMRWYDEIYMGNGYNDDDATDTPKRHGGNPDVYEYIYYRDRGRVAADNNGVYYPISQGNYTAVCSVRDQYGYIDIVANYAIRAVEEKRFYEIHFNIRQAVDGNFDKSWSLDSDTYRFKTKAGGLVNTFEKDGVSYRVFRRPAE